MKPVPECVPDALAMIIDVAKAVSDDDFIHKKVLLKVMGELAEDGEFGSHPSDVYLQCWEIACRALGVKDPYENEKARGDKTALGVLKYLDERKPEKSDPVRDGVRTSFLGAMLDFSGLGRDDMQEKVVEYLNLAPDVDDTDQLVDALAKASSVLFVANRAGEIALDKVLCDTLARMGKKVWLAVAAKPVFLLATERDAETVGIKSPVEIVNPGTAMYGLMPERTSSEIRSLMTDADVVIAKGCTNFSTMTPSRDIYFILKGDHDEVAGSLCINVNGGAIAKVGPDSRR